MNLTMIFLVLSAFIAYLLYDMFKKSRQQQQLAQAQSSTISSSSNKATSRLKPNYQFQCSLLHRLHQQKMNTIKHRNISIHLDEEQENNLSEQTQIQISNLVKGLLLQFNVYLLVCRKKVNNNPLITALRRGGAQEIGYEGVEGAVAVLRQLNCGVHLQSELNLYHIIVQYLPVVWLAAAEKVDSTHQFKNQLQMLLHLQGVLNKKGKQTKEQ